MKLYKYQSAANANTFYPKDKASSFFKPRLPINQPGDRYEHEADAIAEQVMQSQYLSPTQHSFLKPAFSPVQQTWSDYEPGGKLLKKGRAGASDGTAEQAFFNDTINSGGQPIEINTRSFMESRLGYKFSDVRIHNDSLAHQSSDEIDALAYTYGNHIVFNEGEYQPQSQTGKYLLAHELTHVVQQKGREAMIHRLVRKSDVKDCMDQSDKPSSELLAAEQKAFDLLRKGIDKIQAAEDEYQQAVHKYSGPTLRQLEEFKEAFEMGRFLKSAFGFPPDRGETWHKLHIIKIRFMKTISYLDSVVFQYVCQESGDMCPEKRFAFVDINKDRRTINLCPKFWGSSVRDRGLTIAHEIMHLWGGGLLKDTTEEIFGITKETPKFLDVNRYENFLRMITN